MNEDERDAIEDLLPKDFTIAWTDEDGKIAPGTMETWGMALDHQIEDGRCRTCGRGGSCTLFAFYDAVVSSVIRELGKIGALKKPPALYRNPCCASNIGHHPGCTKGSGTP